MFIVVVGLVTSTIGDLPDTVMDSSRLPNFIVSSSTWKFAAARRRMPSRMTIENPASSTFSV